MTRQWHLSLLLNQVFFAAACLLAVMIALFPISIIVSTALKTRDKIYTLPQTWIPRPIAWNNLVDVWSYWPTTSLAAMFVNSLTVALGVAILTMLLAVPAAYAMAKAQFAGRQVMSLVLLSLQMFSPVVIIQPLYNLMLKLHLLSTYWSLILIDSLFLSAFATWLLMGFFQAIPRDMEKAAIMDGCSTWQVLTRIFLPLAAPGLVVTAIFCFIGAWNEFFFAYTFISSDRMSTLMVGIYRLYAAGNLYKDAVPPWNMLMAMSLYSILPPIFLFMIIRRYLVRGLTSGAVKL
jgi:multiple sugar transport system permease protein